MPSPRDSLSVSSSCHRYMTYNIWFDYSHHLKSMYRAKSEWRLHPTVMSPRLTILSKHARLQQSAQQMAEVEPRQ